MRIRGYNSPTTHRLAAAPQFASRSLGENPSPPVLPAYAPGPLGFLQWLNGVHPDLYAQLVARRPDLVKSATDLEATRQALQAARMPITGVVAYNSPRAGYLAGLGDLSDFISSVTDIGNAIADTVTSVGGSAVDVATQINNLRNSPTSRPIATPGSPPQPFALPGLSGMSWGGVALLVGGVGLWLGLRGRRRRS